jgi:WD40 repeat protein
VLVWEAASCKLLARLTGFHERAVLAVAFSPDGTRLASVGKDAKHSVALYEWRTWPHAATGVCAGTSQQQSPEAYCA